jgi:metal-responsive CopG/Arc/MetJ family transcriptional regulator
MPKEKDENKKTGISVSINEDLLKELDDFCEKSYNASRSTVIEDAVRKFLEEKKRP